MKLPTFIMVTVGFLWSHFEWKVLPAHPCLVARQHRLQIVLAFPAHEVNLVIKSAGSPDSMAESKEGVGTKRE